MKRLFSIMIVVILLLVASSCFADSHLSEFDRKLNGTWETAEKYGAPDIEKFTYPSNKEQNLVSNYPGINDAKYDTTLLEEGNGDIWLLFISEGGTTYLARIAMSEDGNYLYVLGSSQEFFGVYRKIAN